MNFVAIDFETANHKRTSACSIGLAIVRDSKIVETKSFYIHPVPNYYNPINKKIHGISEEQTDSAPKFSELWESELKDYLLDSDLVAHNAPFEKSVLNALSGYYGMCFPIDRFYDTLCLSRQRLDLLNYRLDTVCDALDIKFSNHHDALADAIGCAEIVLKLSERLEINDLDELFAKSDCDRLPVMTSLFDTPRCAEDYIANADAIEGKAFCFTGSLSYIQRDLAKELIEKAGGIFKTGISSKVDYLVVGDLSEFGDNYASAKLKKLKEYRAKGHKIELLTEDQFREIVIYEGPKITQEMVEHNSKEFLKANIANALCGKKVCISEGFDSEFHSSISLLGALMGPTHYEDEASQTDYYIISNKVIEDLFEKSLKSPTVLRIESAMKKQLDPTDEGEVHKVKFINEDAMRQYIEKRLRYEDEVAKGIESKSMILK